MILVPAMLLAGCSTTETETASSPETAATSPSADAGPTSEPEDTTSTADDVVAEPDMLDQVRIRIAPTMAFGAPFQLLPEDGELAGVTDDVDLDTWGTPDLLRAMLVNGESEVTAVPSYVGANLSNRGVDVKLAAMLVWGILYVVGPEGAPADWESLRGQTVLVPMQNDMPDLVFRYLAEANGLVAGTDYEIQYYAQAPEIVNELMKEDGKFAVLFEHVATVALDQAQQNGRSYGRILDLQEEWGGATGGEARIPQAGIVIPGDLAEESPELVGAILTDLEQAVEDTLASSDEDVATIAEAFDVPAPIVKDVIPRLNLQVVPADEAREELEEFYSTLAELSPDIIGGQLPEESFYLADPRQ